MSKKSSEGGVRKGPLSTKEKNRIIELINTMTIDEIAQELNRSKNTVRNFMKKNGLHINKIDSIDKQHMELRIELRNKIYFDDIKKQLLDEELEYFIETWVSMMIQFNRDVLFSEELQIKEWIILDILLNRAMKERKLLIEEARRLQRMINQQEQLQQREGLDENRVELIIQLQAELNNIRASLPGFNTEHTKLLGEQKHITKDLKATRDKRLQRIENSKENWAGFLKLLEEEQFKNTIGEEIEVFRHAVNKVEENMSEYYTYADGVIDKPLMNIATMKEEDEET